jgi:hypothetical protein
VWPGHRLCRGCAVRKDSGAMMNMGDRWDEQLLNDRSGQR